MISTTRTPSGNIILDVDEVSIWVGSEERADAVCAALLAAIKHRPGQVIPFRRPENNNQLPKGALK